MSNTKLRVKNLNKNIGRRKIIQDLSFEVNKGDICGFLGPNGAGKTTTIRMITGLIKATSGEITISGKNIVSNRGEALENLGAIVESPIFFPYMSGRKNLQNLARLNKGMERKKQLDKVEEVLEIVGLKDRAKDKVKTYSLGMKQRLGIAQALLNDPEIVILDEPANGLDPMGMKELRELIIMLKETKGITFFISSHLLDELQQVCNKLVLIKEGVLIWTGTTEELIKESSNSGRLEDAFINIMTRNERII
ncbi:ABC transporter ATP-binding protein [Clostridium intestinale]|uniref:ABC-type multidrug transport system, ATPase component n=1 Tax=Clostridium intestinale DSM 6191 TaxID=1121320 RepID=A0A1M5XTY3_9CLOT|nr:ABC transporter ATP-binding protein [Clostridium intestinale]SHI02988.1 ABC-type multidrug transport system, ATPase component [Clostridium intestinale DSM 6191]